ncbi:S-adenosylmethionine:tRNA ribosyltransferase-isomerase [Tunicatimonas pelagia]|uniref:S-adenosylmethionine:tRNA ribosyltransferase-isomerase n=1 Tax=Tunicatimonas pelagia TaxID=931531 RepID=UPI00266606D4|nr:S-adenosylmethionine:tRNA ribosyltransferase-isomerase [Tunicatimonas pelagia]WKN42730.1 S-adenosylmethionine:tRNA ribosyltransferase-isomerase [Tunicatimonas pelagia]
MKENSLRLDFYDYDLPKGRIAKHPLAKRDQSKLLVYQAGTVEDRHFYDLPMLLPDNSCLCFNNTQVIPARLFFRKPATEQGAGALIEILLLHPLEPSSVMSEAMSTQHSVTWECMVGNLKKWKSAQVLVQKLIIADQEVTLEAELIDSNQKLVRLNWNAGISFAEVVGAAGKVPLPPYLNRKNTAEDRQRYQTVYAQNPGAVAAPTAGLHFTDQVLNQLMQRGINFNELTLHVGAGTFQPIKENDIKQHNMHAEQMVVTRENVEKLLNAEQTIVAVGTTSMRTLESLYWYGVKLSKEPSADFQISKLYPYEDDTPKQLSLADSLQNILNRIDRLKTDTLVGETEIFIFPGYQFRLCQGLITNFHLPKSTLILLIAAFVGEDWRKIYQHALGNEYRFLSYGDSSLLLRR